MMTVILYCICNYGKIMTWARVRLNMSGLSWTSVCVSVLLNRLGSTFCRVLSTYLQFCQIGSSHCDKEAQLCQQPWKQPPLPKANDGKNLLLSITPPPRTGVKSRRIITHLQGKKQGSWVCCINIFPDVIFSAGLLAYPSRTEPNAQEEIV